MIDMDQFGKKQRLQAVKMGKREAKALYAKAMEAAAKAAAACVPTPMIVGEGKSLFSNDIDYNKPTYFVADGVCGFAWVEIRPSRGGFASYLKEIGVGRYDDYRRCYYVSAGSVGNQSMQIKEAWGHAFAEVLREAGINAYTASRMD